MTMAQAIAGAIAPDRMAWQQGYDHARAGLCWRCPDHLDLLAYSLGHAAGVADCSEGQLSPAPTVRLS
ncbi:MAG: hypothetical protein IT481_08380 [Gammaproteobacteria bacterium]|nr:hypothetical protein [Gammaproteobacteria bacterium]